MVLPVLAIVVGSVALQSAPATGAATLTGVVRDQAGSAVPGASVDVTCGTVRKHVVADAAGAFEIKGLPATSCTAKAMAPLFEARTQDVDLSRGSATSTLVLLVSGYTTEVVVTPGRGLKEEGFSVPDALSVTSRREIDSRPFDLLPQLLADEVGVLVQKTTSAQGSPTIRGFTGQSNVYLIDGVRLNTASWRSGPSQYVGWVDASVANAIEVVRGPGSVEYGSDALGGTVNVLTSPMLMSNSGLRLGGGAHVGFGSADDSANAEGSLQMQLSRASLRFGASTRSVENLRAGQGEDSHAAVTRYLGLPSSVVSDRLLATDYEQHGANLGGTFDIGQGAALNLLYMHSNQTGASRYDRVLGGDGNYRSGFDPQTLDFGLLRYQRGQRTAGFDGVTASLSINRQADGRFEQARPTARVDAQKATTTAIGYQAQGHREISSHRLLAGVEFYDESLTASRQFQEPNGSVSAQRPDIPDGTTYSSLGVFLQDSVDLLSGRLNVRGGLRYARFNFATEEDSALGVTAEQLTMDDLTFQVGTVVSVTNNINVTGKVSRGFRAANAADLGDIGLTGGGGFSITPSKAAELGGLVGTTAAANAVSTGERIPALSAEIVYSYEGGVKFRSRRVDATFTAYDVEYHDTIQRRAIVFDSNVVGTVISGFEIVRQDASGLAYIAQDVRPIGTRVNVDQARIVGFDVQADVRIARHWTGEVHYSLSNGRLANEGEYLRRMPPPLGGGRVRWHSGRLWIEGAVTGAGTQTRLNSGDISDARIGALRTRASIGTFFNGTATDMGLVQNGVLVATGETLGAVQNRVLGTAASAPLYTTGEGFVIVNLRAGWQFADGFELAVMGENLTDRNYRVYGSGVDGPGAHAHVRLRYRF